MRESSEVSAPARVWMAVVVIAVVGCGDDDKGDQGAAGSPSIAAGSGGAGSGAAGTSGSGAAGAGTGGSGGSGGSAGTMMDAGMRCGTMVCPTGERCVNGECVAPMCAGEPGDPVHPDEDAGTDDGAQGDDREFEADGCPPNESCVFDGDDAVCRCGSRAGCPSDQQCNEDGECTCGGEDVCESGEQCCGERCVDLDADEDNCGRCGETCREGHECRDGECRCPEQGETLCGELCVDLDTDEDNCGECGEQCPDGATCDDGECRCEDEDEIACDGECVPGNTEDNCGECGEQCETPSTCRDPSGPRGLGCYCPNVNDVPCDGACVALGTTQNCGACGDRCDGPANTCRAGSCQCPTAGQTACGDGCFDLRTGIDADEGEGVLITHCGACGVTCLAGEACVDGECTCSTASTIDEYCDEDPITGAEDGTFACIDVDTTKNCGECGNACLDDSACRGTNGSDAPEDFACVCTGSDAGKTHCPGVGCRTLSSDEQHCGACGNVCPDDATCRSGTCDCPGGNSVRACRDGGEPTCVDTDTDEDHCGSCGNACDAGEECCNGDCVDPDSAYDEDRLNCGACGTRCADEGCGLFGWLPCECNAGTCQQQ